MKTELLPFAVYVHSDYVPLRMHSDYVPLAPAAAVSLSHGERGTDRESTGLGTLRRAAEGDCREPASGSGEGGLGSELPVVPQADQPLADRRSGSRGGQPAKAGADCSTAIGAGRQGSSHTGCPPSPEPGLVHGRRRSDHGRLSVAAAGTRGVPADTHLSRLAEHWVRPRMPHNCPRRALRDSVALTAIRGPH